MDKTEKIGIGIVGTVVAGLAGLATYVTGLDQGLNGNRPTSVYQADVDSDGLKDIIVETPSGDRYIFLRDESGHYEPFSKYSQEAKDAANNAIKQKLDRIEKKARESK